MAPEQKQWPQRRAKTPGPPEEGEATIMVTAAQPASQLCITMRRAKAESACKPSYKKMAKVWAALDAAKGEAP